MNTFTLPDLGEGLNEAVVTEWIARPGERLTRGAPMLSVETAKAVVDIPAPEDLRLHQTLIAVGQALRVGQPLFTWSPADTPQATAPDDPGSVVGQISTATGETPDRTFLTGSRHYDADARARAEQRCADSPDTPRSATPRQEGARLQMQRNLASTHREVVPVTVFDEARWRQPPKSILPALVQALCQACRDVPVVNAWLEGESLQPREHIHIGIAVDTAYGLVVPVLRHADRLPDDERAAALEALVLKAREQRLTAADRREAGITLSSYGGLGGRFATPLVTPPQVAILGVGSLRREYQPDKRGRPKTHYLLPVSLTFDHRALTGAEAIRFLNAFMAALPHAGSKKNRP
jgi:2-oxoisovalerate dehydrogenase E2 component (dihydrolipoyl transacylase)